MLSTKQNIFLICLYILFIYSCELLKEGVDGGDNDSSSKDFEEVQGDVIKGCPQDMVEIRNKFCIDRFEEPSIAGSYPLTNITWHEANEVCVSKGKRLCMKEEWLEACNNGSIRVEACNGGGSIAASGTYPECVSSYGVYDLPGNVSEWSGTATINGGFWVMGGSFMDGYNGIGCEVAQDVRPFVKVETIGFRCCKELK